MRKTKNKLLPLSKLDNLSTEQILNQYELPHRFLAYYASQCAKQAMANVKKPDPRSLLAIEVAERFGNGSEEYSQEYLEKVKEDAYAAALTASSAYSASSSSSAAAYYASASAYDASSSSSSASASATYAAPYASRKEAEQHFKELLISLINTRLTKLEKLLIFNGE
jgi:hypothetical protein